MQKNNVEFPPGGVQLHKRLKYSGTFRGQSYVVFEDCNQFIIANRNAFQRLPVTEMATDHSLREWTATLHVTGFRVYEHPILVGQITPVYAIENLEFHIQSIELLNHCLAPSSGTRQIYDDAFHPARCLNH